MEALIKPKKLQPHDRIAIISPSSGRAGDPEVRWRYEQGKKALEEQFHLEVIAMPHTCKGSDYVYQHPEKRAEDLMQAFQDDRIKAIICAIGGSDSIRMLPYIDFDIIKAHPKILSGYSDSTVLHMMCYKAGISSSYGPSLLNDFAENGGIPAYTINAVKKTWFVADPIGQVKTSTTWSAQRLPWTIENQDKTREFQPNHSYEVLQGTGNVKGRLIGGCLEVLEYCKGTSLFPPLDAFNDAILFLETSEVQAPPWLIMDELRCYGIMGLLSRLKGILWGKPHNESYEKEYKEVILSVCKEFQLEQLPILMNGSFGHNEPKTIIPYGIMAEIDCDHGTFTLLESAVTE